MINKNKLIGFILALIIALTSQVYALGEKASDFTGDSFYVSPIIDNDGKFKPIETDYETKEQEKMNNPSRTIPPLKLIRLKAKAYMFERNERKNDYTWKCYGANACNNPFNARNLAPHVDSGVRRNKARYHLKDRQRI